MKKVTWITTDYYWGEPYIEEFEEVMTNQRFERLDFKDNTTIISVEDL